MKCPYCDAEMQKGFVPTDETPPQWIPDGKKTSLLKMKYAKDCKKIVFESTSRGLTAVADYCEHCGVILLREER